MNEPYTSLRKSDGMPRKLRAATNERASNRQARKIIEAYIGHSLPRRLLVHHRDGDPFNNELSNLNVVNHLEHYLEHKDDCKAGRDRRHSQESREITQ